MKSASVAIYKRPRTLLQSPQKNNNVRILVNKGYESLNEKDIKQSHKQNNQKIRSRTARIMDKVTKQRKNIISSLNIISIMTPQPTLLTQTTLKKMSSSNIFTIKRNSRCEQNFTLKLPQHSCQSPNMQRMLLRTSAKQIVKHTKIKLLTKIKCQKQATLIISIDFVYNQFNFWEQELEQIQECSIHTWRLLLPLVNIIWIVRSQISSKKLMAFTENKGLRLDGIIQIQPNKKQPLTVSYYPLQKQMNLPRAHKLLIINSIRTTPQTQISQFQFRNTLPIISHPSTYIHFIHMNPHNKTRLSLIKKIVTQQLPPPYNIHQIFQQHKQKKSKQIPCKLNKQLNIQQFVQNNSDIAEKLQKTKQSMLSYFQKSFGLRTKLQGDSLNYIIGDILKRNYKIAKDFYKYVHQFQYKNKYKDKDNLQINHIFNNKIMKIQYNRNVYVWQY